jgi:hypothetical protein
MARLDVSPKEAIEFHREFERATLDTMPEWTRDWIMDAVTPGTHIHEAYRRLEWDLDGDVCKGSGEFREDAETNYSVEDAAYDLRQVWRRLMRRYAVCEAMRVGGLIGGRSEPLWWRVWRAIGYSLPRLAVALLAGYLFIHGSSGLQWWISRFAGESFGGAVAMLLATALLLGGADVQRRVGRRMRPLLWRSGYLFLMGLLYAAIGCAVHWGVHRWWDVKFEWREAVLWAATALLVAFTVQLFWSDRSIAEPL